MNGSIFKKNSFSMKKIGKYFCICQSLNAQDADGWQGRGHVGWQFAEAYSDLQDLLRTYLMSPNILGDFLADHLDEIAGGRMVALEQANNLLRPIVIGSARLGVRKCAAMWLLF